MDTLNSENIKEMMVVPWLTESVPTSPCGGPGSTPRHNMWDM